MTDDPEHTGRRKQVPGDARREPQARLPCRGCTAQCGLYPVCNGTPWREHLESRANGRPAGACT